MGTKVGGQPSGVNPVAHATGEAVIRKDEQIGDALVISLAVIVPQRLLSKQNHALQAGLLYGADEAFGVALHANYYNDSISVLAGGLKNHWEAAFRRRFGE
jgi:hypothetical protein